ncbi:MAG TPA: tetratricopeptide repeat protein [Candidatus Dormibacteraeota bacterium]
MSTAGGARALIAAARFEDAARLLVQGLATDGESLELLCLLAQCEIGLGRLAEALEHAGRAAALDADGEWPHRLRAIALENLGRKREALEASELAVSLAPELALAHQVHCSQLLRLRRWKAAEEAATAMLRLAPEEAESHNALGRVHLGLKRWKLAEAEFSEALRLQPDEAVYVNNLAVALNRQRRRAEAQQLLTRAARLDPSLKLARKNLFSVTQARLLGGLGLSIFLSLQLLTRTSSLARYGPIMVALLIVMAGIVLVLVMGGVAVWRMSRLDPTVRSFYVSEVRRRWLRLALRPVVLIGGVLVLLVAYLGLLVDRPPVYQLVLAALPVVVWALGAPWAWNRFARPWLATRGWD